MKKLIALLLCFVFAACISACAKNSPSQTEEEPNNDTGASLQIPNPMSELTKEEFETIYGASTVPEGATDVQYYKIESEDINIAQIDFAVKGREYCFRFSKGEESDISGMYYEWEYDSAEDTSGDKLPACHLRINTVEGVGLCSWYDEDKNYSLSISSNADKNELIEVFNHLYEFYSVKYGE